MEFKDRSPECILIFFLLFFWMQRFWSFAVSCLPLWFWTLGGSRSPNRAEWGERACQWWKLPCGISNTMYSRSVKVVHHNTNLVWGLYLYLRILLRKISSFPSFYQKMLNIPAIFFPGHFWDSGSYCVKNRCPFLMSVTSDGWKKYSDAFVKYLWKYSIA